MRIGTRVEGCELIFRLNFRLAMDRPGVPPTKTPSPPKKGTPAKMNKNYSVEIKPLSLEEKEKIYFDLLIEWYYENILTYLRR